MAPSGYEKQICNIQLMLVPVKAPYLILCFFHYGLMTSGDVICNITTYADDTALYSKCDQPSELWEQLDLASELVSDLWVIEV